MPDSNPGLTWGEKLFVGGFAVFSFVVALGFVIATVGWGMGFPAVFVAIVLGVCIASIVYAFLGGVAGAEFSAIKGVKVAGTLAAIVIVYYLISGPLEKNMNDVTAIQNGKAAEAQIRQLRGDLTTERAAKEKAEEHAQELQANAAINRSNSDASILAQIAKSSANDDLGRGVLNLYRNRQGPFHSDTIKLESRFLEDVPAGTFRFCHDSRPELTDKQVQFEIVDPDTGSSRRILLKAGADIGPGACQIIKFDVQLGCDAAQALLQVDCDQHRGVAWSQPSDNRIYQVVATVADPDFN